MECECWLRRVPNQNSRKFLKLIVALDYLNLFTVDEYGEWESVCRSTICNYLFWNYRLPSVPGIETALKFILSSANDYLNLHGQVKK